MVEEMELTFKGMRLLVEFTCEVIDDMYLPQQKLGVDVVSVMEITPIGHFKEIDLTTNELTLLACDIATRYVDETGGMVH